MLGEVLDIAGISEGSLCLDIGAYIGNWSKAIVGRGGSVYAIEADIDNFKELCKDLPPGITPCNYAISDRTTKERIYWSKHPRDKTGSSQSNSLFKDMLTCKPWTNSDNIYWDYVPAHTIDSFCKRNLIDSLKLVKINCEGGEYRIFNSPTNKWLDITETIYCCFHDTKSRLDDMERIVEDIESWGFVEHRITSKDYERFLWTK